MILYVMEMIRLTLSWHHDFVVGVIYFRAYDDVSSDDGVRFNIVLSFDLKSDKNTGEVVMELQDADNYDDSSIGVYEPLSGHIYDVGINGKLGSLSAWSYVESLLLLDDADSIIH
nr:hypothetical protein [Tanacetum cinerariifolium]